MTTLERLGRWALAVLPWALLLACLGGGAELGLLGTLEASGQVQRPNVLVIVVDDQTFASLAVMPALSNDASWTRFRRAYINDATCCPSRGTILTGQYSHHTGVETSHDGPNLDARSTLATWLDLIYETAFFGKYLNGWPYQGDTQTPPGWDRWEGFVGKAAYYDYTLNVAGQLEIYGHRYSTSVLATGLDRFIGRTRQPFFAYFAPKSVHAPFLSRPRDAGRLDSVPIDHPPDFNERGAGAPRWWRDLPPYDRERRMHTNRRIHRQWDTLLSLDRSVSGILDALRERGILANTDIFYISDNGVSFGSHRWPAKECAYEECDHVPFLVRYPQGSPRRIDSLVSNVDLAPTIADLAGVEPTLRADGTSLVPLLDGDKKGLHRGVLLRVGPPRNTVEDPPEAWGIRTMHWQYIRTVGTAERELYNLDEDPYELHSLDGKPGTRAPERRLAREMRELRGP